MTEVQPPMTIRDPQVMRALAHPARIEILEHLGATGSAVTATECAELVGLSPSATSYHLRELAKIGMIEQAPSRGDGRERVWRSTAAGWRVQGDAISEEDRAAESALVDTYLTRDFARLRDWYARQHEAPAQWREASALMGQTLLLTPEELVEVNTRVQALLRPYRQRERMGSAPEGSATVVVHYAAYPM